MARRNNIKFELKETLGKMSAFGSSKHEFKLINMKKRAKYKDELMQQGYSRSDAHKKSIRDINYLSDKIFSDNTMKSYQAITSRFADYIIEIEGTKNVSFHRAQDFIQDFLDHEKDRGLSPATLHLYRAAICKVLKRSVTDFVVPSRNYTDSIVKSSKNSEYEAVSVDLDCRASILNRAIGLRRSELKKLSLNQITETERGFEVRTIGKGGKHNLNLVTDEGKIEVLKSFINEATVEHRNTLLRPDDTQNDLNLHYTRSLCAQDNYDNVLKDITENPKRRDFYIREIEERFKEMDKTPSESLKGTYRTRGKNREILKTLGRPLDFDRTALMHTSLFILNHWRSDVTVQHYLVK